ncbi:GNAT family N-acetyltransferase [Maribacter algicola]|uniref:GNAT family N-acetyltransferase n=1 Tax=Meishania litoralis TaxID=3434685 RepID=A0ACC7LG75_9FLAO
MIAFRTASKHDYRAIAALHAKSWQQNYRGALSDNFLDNKVVEERLTVWKGRLENPRQNQFVLVAEIGNEIVGFICGYIDDHQKYGTLIDNLHVDSNFIGRRIGERLMIDAAGLLKEKGRTSMYLWVLIGNTKAARFYERIGGNALETINDIDIGDCEITKTRYYWPDLEFISRLAH